MPQHSALEAPSQRPIPAAPPTSPAGAGQGGAGECLRLSKLSSSIPSLGRSGSGALLVAPHFANFWSFPPQSSRKSLGGDQKVWEVTGDEEEAEVAGGGEHCPQGPQGERCLPWRANCPWRLAARSFRVIFFLSHPDLLSRELVRATAGRKEARGWLPGRAESESQPRGRLRRSAVEFACFPSLPVASHSYLPSGCSLLLSDATSRNRRIFCLFVCFGASF